MQAKEVDDCEVGLFAIFDNHSGNDVASYLRNHLFDNNLNEVYVLNALEFIASSSISVFLILLVTNLYLTQEMWQESMGNWQCRGHLVIVPWKEHISSEPDVVVQMIKSEAEFIILAGDGLWKVRFYLLFVLRAFYWYNSIFVAKFLCL